MTPLSDVYSTFLSKVSDYNFLKFTQEQIENYLLSFLKSAIARFHRCKNDLTIQSGSFTSTLEPLEVEILVKLMIVEYMNTQILSSEILKQSLSDKDFRIYSQANQLKELNLTYRMFRTEANKLITEYGYMGIDGKELL